MVIEEIKQKTPHFCGVSTAIKKTSLFKRFFNLIDGLELI